MDEMTFNKKEIDLLRAAYQAFVGKTHTFEVYKSPDWENTGIENWVQTEFTVALVDRDYSVTTEGKVKRGCDLIVKNDKLHLDVGIEIRAYTCVYPEGLIDGIEKHPKADLYLFLSQFDNESLSQLNAYFKKNGYIENHRTFSGWMVMLVKKEHKIERKNRQTWKRMTKTKTVE
ncbi:hypothetical protein KEJ15_00360 [Candidatus Bathyarchaeota archaeon]|nr:hypothetical protein [Candidatus Bathyarchaeota archaeon]